MPRKVVDTKMAVLAVEAIRSKRETIRSVRAKTCISKISLARFVGGQVEMDGRPGLPTTLSVAEEVVIEDLLVYAGSHYLGLTRTQLGEAVRKLCNDSR